MSRRFHFPTGFSLMELMIVVAIMGLLAGLILPQFQPGIASQLESTADILAADFTYARNLAVTNGSKYRITFDLANNCYSLEHTGTRSALNTLPKSPFHSTSASATVQTTKLDDLPHLAARPVIAAVLAVAGTSTAVTNVEFDSLGATSRSESTQVWLSAGQGSSKRYLVITIDPTTGMTEIGALSGTAPPTL